MRDEIDEKLNVFLETIEKKIGEPIKVEIFDLLKKLKNDFEDSIKDVGEELENQLISLSALSNEPHTNTYYDEIKKIKEAIKTVIIDNLPEDIYSYRRTNPRFPEQTTFDQFFDEKQFEAYRELGFQLGFHLCGGTSHEDFTAIFKNE